jgi:hypothetical protein
MEVGGIGGREGQMWEGFNLELLVSPKFLKAVTD